MRGRYTVDCADKLPDTGLNDNSDQGIASTPTVEGGRVYYVSNRAEVVCADAEGQIQTSVHAGGTTSARMR